MKSPEDNNQNINDKQDEISATVTDANATEKPADDSFKSPNKKNRLGWETPLDEQAYDDTDLSETDKQ